MARRQAFYSYNDAIPLNGPVLSFGILIIRPPALGAAILVLGLPGFRKKAGLRGRSHRGGPDARSGARRDSPGAALDTGRGGGR